ncbi:MAG: 1-acyl-sn-glycerol-3-phosphate acyltransferase [Clostridia bacterium]|nr:1-acyl-sn-glycerol-3-phosphate acyltransferase [Clostridia bacterium]
MNFRTIRWFSKVVFSLIGLIPKMKKGVKLKNTGDLSKYKPFVDAELTKWLNPLMSAAGVNFVVNGKENIPENEAVIYVPNHQGLFDMPAIILNTPTPCGFIAKKELKKVPIVRTWMWLLDCVFIDRQNKREARVAIKESVELIKKGRSMVIFPEGTRSRDGIPLAFKSGVMMIAKETKAKIVPVVLEGVIDRFEGTGNITPGTVNVTFLPCVETDSLSREELKAVPDKLRNMIVSKLKENGSIPAEAE